jgi:hypothetical protein
MLISKAIIIALLGFVVAFLLGCGSGSEQADRVTAEAHGSKDTEHQDPAPKMIHPKPEKGLCSHGRISVGGPGEIKFSASCRDQKRKGPQLKVAREESRVWLQRD